MTTLDKQIETILDEVFYEQEGVTASHWGRRPVNKAIAALKRLIKEVVGAKLDELGSTYLSVPINKWEQDHLQLAIKLLEKQRSKLKELLK